MRKFDVETILSNCTISEYFWHTDDTIFDVLINYDSEVIGMISFSKRNEDGQWWEQSCEFWKKWDISNYFHDEKKLISIVKNKRELADKLIKKARKIYKEN